MENFFIELCMAFWHLLRPFLTAFSPVLTGLILAWLLSPAAEWLKPKFGSVWAIVITYSGLFFIVTAAAGSFIILILGALPTGNTAETAEVISRYFRDASAAIFDFSAKYLPGLFPDAGTAEAGLHDLLSRYFSLESIASAISSFSSAAITLFLGMIASVYLLKDRDYFFLLWNRFLSLVLNQNAHGILSELLHEINQVVYAFLRGALIDSLIVALLSSAALSILNINYAVVIGILAGLLNVIPYFGPFIGMIPAFLTAFFQGGLAKSIAAVLSLLIIQQIDSNIIYPRIVGISTGLHPLFVLISVSVFGYFFGLAGMLLAVPAAGVLQIFVKRWAYR